MTKQKTARDLVVSGLDRAKAVLTDYEGEVVAAERHVTTLRQHRDIAADRVTGYQFMLDLLDHADVT